ncbi:MAG: hypothetical protein A2Z88_09180 [Omnitrophica WOR_2 bacterium GWA2_47_8]|nr:MAG: hypothetical protein A2Z88_09180 [Omnitrophica WOR_2 bacterium GWA2_47_8]
MKSIFKKKVILLTFLMLVLFLPDLRAQLSINFVAVNPSDTTRKFPIKHYLPQELTPEDILDLAGLKLEYDVDRDQYYLFTEAELGPKESRTFKIKVKDIWNIQLEEVDAIKKQLEANLEILKDKEVYPLAVTAKERIEAQIDYIYNQQVNYSQNVERRIEEYRANVDKMERLRQKAYSLDALTTEARSLEDVDLNKTIKFYIEVKNPSDKEEKTFTQKHFLPEEIGAEHVLDSQGFIVRYDEKKKRKYLTKEETFKPAEVKKYEITIKDVWQFSISRLDAVRKRADLAIVEIRDSSFKENGEFLYNSIIEKLDIIQSSQKANQSIRDHIGGYRLNQKRFAQAENDLQNLEHLLAIVRAKKLEELEKGKVKNILQKLKALRGLAALSEAVFKKGIKVTTTWRIIFGTIIFLGIFTTWHFITWHQRSRTMGEEKGLKPGEPLAVVPKPGEQEPEKA